MHPVLLTLGNFELHSYGVALAVSLLAGMVVAMLRAPRFGIKPVCIVDAAIVLMVGAIVGSRAWYVVNHLDQFRGHWLDVINPVQDGRVLMSGLAMNGGVVLAITGLGVLAWARGIRPVALLDTIAPSFLLGAGIQRLCGCFLNGCCHGTPTDCALGITFPPEAAVSAYPAGVALWPTQLFAAGFGFAGFGLVLWYNRRYRFPGAAFSVVFVYYCLTRFLVDQFRYYPPQQLLFTVGGMTFLTDHVVLAGVLLASVCVWVNGVRTQ